jgi:DNA-binding response OmpR family regulator
METPKHILVVEDEEKIRSGLKDFLDFHGFRVALAEDGLTASQVVNQNTFDLILLDLMLPHISGQQLCATWRKQGLITPIIMLTAKGQQHEKIEGLDLGADDYITKPFSLEELLARIRAIFRRTDPTRSVGQRFAFGPFTVDMTSLTLAANSRQTQLNPRQASMIQFFAANPNRIVSRNELYENVWRESMNGVETRTVDMHIVRLRELLTEAGAKTELIHTVRGAGYQFKEMVISK